MNDRSIASESPRPDPDAVLARVQAEAARQARGRLRIYFGASAGVGKTYAMLAAARRARGEGRDVVVGLVETHGRGETAALLEGLEVLPRREMPARVGRSLQEFDLDAALARRPSLLLVDELAHSNAPGCRHPKRWQDVQELLDAGIEVHSTLNVQHLESLNAVVGGITGIRVMETVPDTVLEVADEVVLVDVTADELLARLAQGKVYLPQQAERAAANFFRKGNLIALRELALRRVAEHVGGDVEAWRSDQSIERIWQTGETILAAIGPGPTAEHTVRGAARWATRLETGWQAVYVETPALQRLPVAARERILQTLKLAESMGARTEVLSGSDVAAVLVAHARAHNVGRIAIGRGERTHGFAGALARLLRHGWRPSVRQRLSAIVPEIDLIELSPEPGIVRPLGGRSAGDETTVDATREERRARRPYAWTAAIVVAATLVAWPLSLVLDLANVVMVFLSAVVLVAYRYGRGPSVMASVLGVALFDFFFVSPQLSFAVSDVQYLVTFAAMLAVGLVTGQLTAGLRYQATVAADREARSRELYELARELSGALLPEQIETAVQPALERILGARSWILLPGPQGRIQPTPSDAGAGPPLDVAVAQWCFDKGARAGLGTDTLAAGAVQYLPLKAPMQTRGVLAIAPARPRLLLIPERQRQLDTISHLIAIALERIHYVEVAQAATVRIEGEQLRNSLLSAISHDLRTPLTALVGWADVLGMSRPPMSPEQVRITRSISDEARRTSRLVENLLEMARLQSGGLALRMQWHSIEEIVGSALESCRTVVGDAVIETSLPEDLPMVRCDAVLIERVLANLFENAVKYGVVRAPDPASLEGSARTPVAPRIAIDAVLDGDAVAIGVSDRGPGLPAALVRDGDAAALFDKFTRGERESAVPGLGLGLSICRAIVEAHGGRIEAADRAGGGARFVFRLPVKGTGAAEPPPAVDP